MKTKLLIVGLIVISAIIEVAPYPLNNFDIHLDEHSHSEENAPRNLSYQSAYSTTMGTIAISNMTK